VLEYYMTVTRLNPKRFATGIYAALENALKESDKPLTCADLIDRPEVREWSDDSNKISNCLGHMWRKGLLARHAAPAAHLSMARFAYSWKGDPVDTSKIIPMPRQFVAETAKQRLEVTQIPNGIAIESDSFTITIKLK
jgi:hypothetical protein